MKLRPVVASLVVAGLISSPVIATAKNVRKRHHQRATNTRQLHRRNAAHEAFVFQNNAKSPVSRFDWTNRIHLSGYVNVDGRYANRGPLGIVPVFSTCDDSHEINVNNANVFVDAFISRCVTAHIGFAYVADSVNLFDTGLHTIQDFGPLTESIRSDKGSVFAGGEVSVDEAFITIRDFAESPLYFRAGKMYTPFGVYHNPYPITYSLPQLLSQTRATTAELGFVSNCGLYGSIYAIDGGQSASAFSNVRFDGVKKGRKYKRDDKVDQCIPFTCVNNYGISLGYVGCYTLGTSCTPRMPVNYHVNLGYMKDIRDVAFLTDIQDLFGAAFPSKDHRHYGSSSWEGDGYRRHDDDCIHKPDGFGMKQTGGVSIHADANTCAWHFSFDYVTALRNMIRDPHDKHELVSGTRAWAADITGVYDRRVLGYNTAYALSYQWSRQAGGIMPKWRLQGDVSAEIFHNTSLTFEYRHDCDYDSGCDGFCDFINYQAGGGYGRRHKGDELCGGTGNGYNQATLRLGVVF